jgi:hypothetical protein
LHDAPRTIFDESTSGSAAFYDQISYFVAAKRPVLGAQLRTAGSFDFATPLDDVSKVELAWHISDHLPLWAEFV